MDSIGAFLDEELESWIKMFSSSEDSCSFSRNFALGNLLSNESVLKVDQSAVLPSDVLETNFYSYSSQESGESSDINTALFANQPNGVHFPPHEAINTVDSMDFNTMGCNNVPVFTDEVMEEILQLKAQLCNDQLNYANTHLSETGDSCTEKQLKRKYEAPHTQSEEMSSESPKKKSRVPRNAQQSKRNVQSRKKKVNNEEDNSSDDTSNTTQEPNERSNSESKDCLNSNGKERSGKGCATDPQSLYARVKH